MSAKRVPAETKIIKGYILSEKDDVSESEDEEEDRQPEFLDMKEMNSVSTGGKLFKTSVPALKRVKFRAGKQTSWIEGRFHLHDPWWEISCEVHKEWKNKLYVKGYPLYSLRTNLRSEVRSIASLFLKACGALPNFVNVFMEWLPEDRYVEPANVLDALQDFEESKPEHKAIAEELKSRVSHSAAGTHVRVANLYPEIMKYLPTLLPGQFMEIISKGKMELTPETTESKTQTQSKTDVLDKLEKLVKTPDIWKLGFSYIMCKDFHLIRCEAKVDAFKQCNLFCKIPVLQQNALLMYAEVKGYCSNTGSTYIEMEKLVERMRSEVGVEDAWAAEHFLMELGVLKREKKKLALRNLFNYEKEIADCLRCLVDGDPWTIKLDVKDVPSTIELDSDQVRAAEMMCANPVTVISGKGGCGKTTLVSLVFKEAEETKCNEKDPDKKPKVLLTAPTGRAASLLTKKTSFTAYTMHQVLWSFMNTKKDKSGNPQDWKFSNVRVMVVDEGSLVSVQILYSILSMLTKHAQLQKFIILGDVRQLPSIEPGNTLCDLFEGFRKLQWAIDMKTNHRAESELIIKNAGLISEMGMKRHYSPLEFDAIIDMERPSEVLFSDNSFIFVKIGGEDIDLYEAITFLLNKAPDLKDDKTSQFVAFRRKDCDFINELCCKHYSGHTARMQKNKINLQRRDKVCCTKNSYITDKDDENKQEETSGESAGALHTEQKNEKKERLWNGEIFFILEDVTQVDMGAKCKTRRYLTLDDKNGHLVTGSYMELQRECKLRHAWAKTIHTFQGSEAETIVYVLGDSRVQNWQHVYTAVTRGQKRVYVIGRESDIKRAIMKPIIRRNTRLGSLIKMSVARQGHEGEHTLTQTQKESSVESPTIEISGFGPSQSTPVTHMQNLRSPQVSSSTRPACIRNLYKEETGHNPETSSTSLQDDMPLTQMCDEKQKENMPGGEEAVSEGTSTHVMACKRMLSDNCTTPSKQPKITAEESPL